MGTKKAIEYVDVLGVTRQLKTAIDTFREENEPCWVIASRSIFPKKTYWDFFPRFEGQYFNTDEEAENAIKEYIEDYINKSKKIGLNVEYEEVSI